MRIIDLKIRRFGKLKDQEIRFRSGINLICGPNESGKSTLHAFIRAMLFGLPRYRGKASRTDPYTRYEPWERPLDYAGSMRFEAGGKVFRADRNFYKNDEKESLVCETDGEKLSIAGGDLRMLLGGVGERVYDNTVSIGQLRCETDEGIVQELQNYMANYENAGEGEIDVHLALERLKKKKREWELQKKQILFRQEQQRKPLREQINYVNGELKQLTAQLTQLRSEEQELKDLRKNEFQGKTPQEEGLREKGLRERDLREEDLREKNSREEGLLEGDLCKRDLREKSPREGELREEGLRERNLRGRNLRGRDSQDPGRSRKSDSGNGNWKGLGLAVFGMLMGLLLLFLTPRQQIFEEFGLRAGSYALGLLLLFGGVLQIFRLIRRREKRRQKFHSKYKRMNRERDSDRVDRKTDADRIDRETESDWTDGETGADWMDRERDSDRMDRETDADRSDRERDSDRPDRERDFDRTDRERDSDRMDWERDSDRMDREMDADRSDRETDSDWASRWNRLLGREEELSQQIEEKSTLLRNLAENLDEFPDDTEEIRACEKEIQSLDLAISTIKQLSWAMRRRIGRRLQRRTEEILEEITAGTYTHLIMDESLKITLYEGDQPVLLYQLSRGTVEQVYFALRMAVSELLCEETIPVLLDDVFAMYDEQRLAQTLGWLARRKGQVLLFTCQKREAEILRQLEIPFHQILLGTGE